MTSPKAHHPAIDLAKIEAQAKQIMDGFLEELGSIEQPKEFGLRREGIANQTREGKLGETDPQFRSKLFDNAPVVKDDELVMERKQW